MPRPTFTIRGSTLIVEQGPTRRTHRLATAEEAMALAERLEAQWEARRDAAEDMDRRRAARRAVRDTYGPPPDPEPDPEPEGEPEGEAPRPRRAVGRIAASGEAPPAQAEPLAPEPEGEPPEAVITAHWGPDRVEVEVVAPATEPVTLWRAMGERSATFTVDAGATSRRFFPVKNTGEVFELRLNGPEGPLLAQLDGPDETTPTQ